VEIIGHSSAGRGLQPRPHVCIKIKKEFDLKFDTNTSAGLQTPPSKGRAKLSSIKILIIMKFFSLILLFLFTTQQAFAGSPMKGCSDVYSQLVFDAKTQNILSETRSDKIAYPASLTKLMTLYLTFEALKAGKIKLDDEITVSQRGEEISAINRITTLHLKEGDKITVEQAIKGSIVKSFNEASISLAERVAGDEWQFVRMMNEKALALGMYNTSFRNSTGFHEDGQYTTAFDLARLTIALRRDFPAFYPLFSLRTFEYKGRKFETHNHVLVEYKGAEGMKTGYTKAAGFNLISSARKPFGKKTRKKDMHITNNYQSQELEDRVISIVMGCASAKSRDNFTKQLLDSGFDNIKSFGKNALVSKVNSGFNYGESEVVKLEKADVASEEVEVELENNEIEEMKVEGADMLKLKDEKVEAIESVTPQNDEVEDENISKEEAEIKKEKPQVAVKKFELKKEKSEVKKGKVKDNKVKKSEAKKGKVEEGKVKKAEVKKENVEVKKEKKPESKKEVKKSEGKKLKSEVKKAEAKKPEAKNDVKKSEVKKSDKKSETKLIKN